MGRWAWQGNRDFLINITMDSNKIVTVTFAQGSENKSIFLPMIQS